MSGLGSAPDAPLVPTTEEPLIVVSELFDQISCGTITLSIPLKDEIQMGVRDFPR